MHLFFLFSVFASCVLITERIVLFMIISVQFLFIYFYAFFHVVIMAVFRPVDVMKLYRCYRLLGGGVSSKRGVISVAWKWFGYKRLDEQQINIYVRSATGGNIFNLPHHLEQKTPAESEES